jgi:uncharacterized protein YkwD
VRRSLRIGSAGALFCLFSGWALIAVTPTAANATILPTGPSRLASLAPAAVVAPVAAVTDVALSAPEAQFLAKINQLRSSKGLGTLAPDAQLTQVARNWTAQMVQNGGISHNPNLANDVTENWQTLGENVGEGPDVDTLFTAFVNSPHHYANLVDPVFSLVGIGVIVAPNGTMYTTHDFEQPAGSSTPPPPPPSPPATSPPSPPVTSRPAPPLTSPPAGGGGSGGSSGTSPPAGAGSGPGGGTGGSPSTTVAGGSTPGGGSSPSPSSSSSPASDQQLMLELEELRSFDVTGH